MEYRYQVVARETEPEAAPQAPYRGISEGWAPSCEQLVAVPRREIELIFGELTTTPHITAACTRQMDGGIAERGLDWSRMRMAGVGDPASHGSARSSDWSTIETFSNFHWESRHPLYDRSLDNRSVRQRLRESTS